MTFEQAYRLNQQCAIDGVYPPGEGYTAYPQGQINAHAETTLQYVKTVMLAEVVD